MVDRHNDVSEGGMTLRDYFAAAAMSGFLAANDENFGGWAWAKPSQLATACYEAADAMIEARAK
jgi:hypothetical protein